MESSGVLRLSQWKQCLAVLASTLMSMSPDVSIWFDLKSAEGFFQFIYLVPSVILAICGAIFAAVCCDLFGRKKTVLASSLFVPFMIALDLNKLLPKIVFDILIFVKFLYFGFTSTAIPLYISEITSDDIRRTAMVLPLVTESILNIITMVMSHFVFRSLVAYTIGSGVFNSIRILLFIIILLLCPETPYYLNWRKRCKQTEQSLSFYTGFKYVRTAELIPESSGNSRVTRYAQEWKNELRSITEIKNIRSLGMIFVLILIKWGIGQQYNIHMLLYTLNSMTNFLIVLVASTFLTSFLALAINLFSKKISLLAVIVISFVTTLIGIWIESTIIISILIFVKFLGHIIFTGVTWSSVGVLFSTNVKAIAIAIVVSFDILIGTIMACIEYQIYQQEYQVYQRDSESVLTVPWYHDVPPRVKSYVDIGTLVVAFILVLIFIPKTIKVQTEETFKNYAVVRSGDLKLSELQAEVLRSSPPL